jgi:hypothetical protein
MHPKFGLIDVKRLRSGVLASSIIKMWKYRYGKKFYECQIEKYQEAPIKGGVRYNHLRKLKDLKTGVIYENQEDAAKNLKVSESTIRNHAKRLAGKRLGYLVQYVD